MNKTRISIEIVELEENSFHLFIKAELAHQKSCELVIDTGASKTVFDKSVIEESIVNYQKRDEEITSSGINHTIEDIEFVVIQSLKIGELEIQNYPTAGMDLSHINKLYKKMRNKNVAGLIGSDFLVKYKAIISYKKKELILEF